MHLKILFFIFNEQTNPLISINKEFVINKFPDKIKNHILLNNRIKKSALHYQGQYNQEMSFEYFLEHLILNYKLARNLIIKNRLINLFDISCSSDLISFLSMNIYFNIFYKMKSYQIKKEDISLIIEAIHAFIYGYHKAIFGILPIIENIYKKAYCIPDNHKNAKFISNIPELYNNEMIRNIFLKPSQLIENKEYPIKYCLNIKNDFFHYQFKDDELMEYMAMYVFEFLMKEFVF